MLRWADLAVGCSERQAHLRPHRGRRERQTDHRRQEGGPQPVRLLQDVGVRRRRVGGEIRARETQADRLAEEIIAIADTANADFTVVQKDGTDGTSPSDYEVKVDGELVNRSRVKIEARKWMAGKLNSGRVTSRSKSTAPTTPKVATGKTKPCHQNEDGPVIKMVTFSPSLSSKRGQAVIKTVTFSPFPGGRTSPK